MSSQDVVTSDFQKKCVRCFGKRGGMRGETQVSKARPGPPTHFASALVSSFNLAPCVAAVPASGKAVTLFPRDFMLGRRRLRLRYLFVFKLGIPLNNGLRTGTTCEVAGYKRNRQCQTTGAKELHEKPPREENIPL